MGKVKFKPGYVDLGAYPLLLHIISEGGLEAEGSLNTTLTDPLTVTNVNGNTLLMGNDINNTQNVFISTVDGNDSITGLVSFVDNPFSIAGLNIRTNTVTKDVTVAFDIISDDSGTASYKGIGFRVDGDTGENNMEILCWTDSDTENAVVSIDDTGYDSLISVGTGNNTYNKEYFLKVATIIGGTPFFALTVNGAIQTALTSYASNAAADADTSLPVGGLYQLTGDRTVYRKP